MIKRAFTLRVRIERQVLGVLNDACGEPYLTGLSLKALDRWKSVNSLASRDLVAVMERLSLRAQMDADGSRDVFEAGELSSLEAIEHLVNQLDVCLKNAVAEGARIETEVKT